MISQKPILEFSSFIHRETGPKSIGHYSPNQYKNRRLIQQLFMWNVTFPIFYLLLLLFQSWQNPKYNYSMRESKSCSSDYISSISKTLSNAKMVNAFTIEMQEIINFTIQILVFFVDSQNKNMHHNKKQHKVLVHF